MGRYLHARTYVVVVLLAVVLIIVAATGSWDRIIVNPLHAAFGGPAPAATPGAETPTPGVAAAVQSDAAEAAKRLRHIADTPDQRIPDYSPEAFGVSAGADRSGFVYPLALAWANGAANWPQAERVQFASDPLEKLAGVPGTRGLHGWMPDGSASRCDYVTRYVSVAASYKLAMPRDDRSTAARELDRCG